MAVVVPKRELTTVDQDTGRRTSPEPLRALADYHRAAAGGVVFGVKFTVLHPGKLSVGDEVIVRARNGINKAQQTTSSLVRGVEALPGK